MNLSIRRFFIVFSMLVVFGAQLKSVAMAIEMLPTELGSSMIDTAETHHHMVDGDSSQHGFDSQSCINSSDTCSVLHCVSAMDISRSGFVAAVADNSSDQILDERDPIDGFYISLYRPPISC